MHAQGGFTPTKAAIDYTVWKSFVKPPAPAGFNSNPDVTVDASYAGTINVTNDSWPGRGGYAIGICVGVANSNDSSIYNANVFQAGKVQKLWSASKNAGDLQEYIGDIMQNQASGIVDIMLDALDFQLLSYVKFVLDCAALVGYVFDVDEKVAERDTVVYDAFPMQGGNYILVWLRMKAVISAVWFAHTVLSFWTDGLIEGDLKGNRGLEIGCIGLHYQGPQSPEVIGTNPAQGSNNQPSRPEIKFTFSDNIQVNNANNITLRAVNNAEVVGCTASASGNTLTVKPNQDLADSTTYELTVNPGTVRKTSSNLTNLAPFTLRFTTGASPTVVNTTPPDRASNVAMKPEMTITFNPPVTDAGVAISKVTLRKASGQVIASVGKGVSYSIRASEGKVILSLAFPLEPGQQYFLEIPRDAFRNAKGFANVPYQWSFTTAYPLTVISVSPRDKETDVPVNAPIMLRFNQTITAGPEFNKILVKAGSSTVPVYLTIGPTLPMLDTLTITPKSPLPPNQICTVTLPQGALKNPKTEAPSASFSFSFNTAVNPTAKSTSPAQGSKGVYRDDVIVVRFSEAVKVGKNFNGISVKAGSTDVKFRAGIRYDELVIEPNNPLPANASVTVTIPSDAIVDLKGNSLQSPINFQFTTGTGGLPPWVSFTSPADGESNVSRNATIYVRFTKNIVQGDNWGQITLKEEDGTLVQIQTLISHGSQIEIRPLQPLKKNRRYIVTLPSGCVKETLGTPLQDGYSFSFRTAWGDGGKEAQ
ncbi:MAG: Ig-like domain-containing protein, partial [Armatimonadetes bacterium]|nr:Ig-like domain-containing protein [Armatimonadota bacterium]